LAIIRSLKLFKIQIWMNGRMNLPRIHELTSLKGKTAIVTGAASGIGRATALRLAEAGASLYLLDIDYEGLSKVRDEALGYGVEIELFKVDLSRKEEIDRFWSSIKGREPDILVNNAGIYVFRNFIDVDDVFLDNTMRVNLYSMFWMCQNMVRSRDKKGGIIVNVSSIESILPFARNLVHYDISKIGVLALTRALAREYSKIGFRVNAVVPGGIETESIRRLKEKTLLKLEISRMVTGVQFMSRLPMGRFGHPDEVARVILFLVSELSSYVTGAVVVVDGGFTSS